MSPSGLGVLGALAVGNFGLGFGSEAAHPGPLKEGEILGREAEYTYTFGVFRDFRALAAARAN
jgi:hypothetical protein